MATGTLETVSIQGVSQNERGWYEVETAEYDEPLVTKEKKLADAANAAKGGFAQVQVNVKANGDFTNRYLNDVQPADGIAPTPAPRSADAPAEIPLVSKRDEREETQKRIQAQWAIGRATEIFVGEGGSLKGVLDTDTFAEIQAVAEVMLLGAKTLADKS